MSQTEVLATLRACMQDPAAGLVAKVVALAPLASIPPNQIRTDFNFVAWKLSGAIQQATTPNVMLRPGSGQVDLKRGNHRDSTVFVQVAIEWFDADPLVLQDNITLGATALAQVLDGLRDYSDANQGTVIDVVDPTEFLFGEFTGPASSGFIASIQIQERSRQ